MGSRAAVAVEQEDGLFDIYNSQDGGGDFRIYDNLTESVAGNAVPDVSPLKSRTFSGERAPDVGDNQRAENKLSGTPLIEDTPSRTGVPKKEIGGSFAYFDRELLYVVTSNDVRTYYPALLELDLLSPIANGFKLEYYNAGNKMKDVSRLERHIKESDPVYQVGPNNITDAPWADEPRLRSLLESTIEPLYSAQYRSLMKDYDTQPMLLVNINGFIIVSESYPDEHCFPNVTTGVLFRVSPSSPAEKAHIEETVERVRFESATRILMSGENDKLAVEDEMSEVLSTLIKEIGGSMSQLTPSPFVKAVNVAQKFH